MNKGKFSSKYPYDPLVRGAYFKLYRQYNKTRKFKKRTFKQSILNDELQSSDPKAYWNLIANLKESKKDTESLIDPSVWENYFKSLNSVPGKFQRKLNDLKDTLIAVEQHSVSTFSSLDYSTCNKDIIDGISQLKANKSGGL